MFAILSALVFIQANAVPSITLVSETVTYPSRSGMVCASRELVQGNGSVKVCEVSK